jgi:hypothetical protein
VTLEEPAHNAGQWPIPHRLIQTLGHLRQGQVGLLLDPAKDEVPVLVDPM